MQEESKAVKTVRKVYGVPFKKGDDPRRNLAGHPLGIPNFSTKWNIFMEHMAAEKGTTVEELDKELLAVAFEQMKSGKFPYWKDTQDRIYGPVTQKTEITGKDGGPVQVIGINYILPNVGDNTEANS